LHDDQTVKYFRVLKVIMVVILFTWTRGFKGRRRHNPRVCKSQRYSKYHGQWHTWVLRAPWSMNCLVLWWYVRRPKRQKQRRGKIDTALNSQCRTKRNQWTVMVILGFPDIRFDWYFWFLKETVLDDVRTLVRNHCPPLESHHTRQQIKKILSDFI
jgi:hypothetical protein